MESKSNNNDNKIEVKDFKELNLKELDFKEIL